MVTSFNNDPDLLLLGVFDGHGSDGDSCSYYVRDKIDDTLRKMISKNPKDFQKAYKKTFTHINHNMHKQTVTKTPLP